MTTLIVGDNFNIFKINFFCHKYKEFPYINLLFV